MVQLGKARAAQPWAKLELPNLLRNPQLQADTGKDGSDPVPESPQANAEPATALLRLKRMTQSRAQPVKQASKNSPEVCFTKL